MDPNDYDFGQGFRPGDKAPPLPAQPEGKPYPPWLTYPAGVAEHMGEGAVKSIVGLPPVSYVMPDAQKWAQSQSDWPISEDIGREAPAAIASFMLPELSGLTGLARFAASTGLGAAGGMMESQVGRKKGDPYRAAVEGGGAGALSNLVGQAASHMPGFLGPAAAAGLVGLHHMGHGIGPYVAYKMAHYLGHPLYRGTRWLARHPGLVGAAGEWLGKKTGYEGDDGEESK